MDEGREGACMKKGGFYFACSTTPSSPPRQPAVGKCEMRSIDRKPQTEPASPSAASHEICDKQDHQTPPTYACTYGVTCTGIGRYDATGLFALSVGGFEGGGGSIRSTR